VQRGGVAFLHRLVLRVEHRAPALLGQLHHAREETAAAGGQLADLPGARVEPDRGELAGGVDELASERAAAAPQAPFARPAHLGQDGGPLAHDALAGPGERPPVFVTARPPQQHVARAGEPPGAQLLGERRHHAAEGRRGERERIGAGLLGRWGRHAFRLCGRPDASPAFLRAAGETARSRAGADPDA
jgi:hypothetical protein